MTIAEQFDLERITLSLVMRKCDDKKPTIKSHAKTAIQKAAIIEYLTNHVSGTNADFCKLLDLQSTRVKDLLADLIATNIVVAEGANRNRTYRLKR